jgi:hypothetical protein
MVKKVSIDKLQEEHKKLGIVVDIEGRRGILGPKL